MAHMPSTSGPVAFDLTRAIVSVRDYGAVGDGVTDDTAAIQAAIDAAAELGGNAHGVITYIPASATPYMFSNLKLPAYTVLQGSRIAQCQLKRIEGSTGNAITEKTLAEGNANGAISIWIRDLGILGNGTSGNGIDLGYNVVDVNFETWASLENVLVQDFDSGIGIKIQANAISMKYIYALSNQDGVHATGGYSQFHTVYCEQNTRYQLRAAGTAHAFFGVHLEPGSSTSPALLIEGGAQSFYGVSIYSTVNRDYQIVIATGATKTQLHDVFITGGTVFTHGIYSVDYSNARTGTTAYIGHFEMGDGNVAHWYVNADTGNIKSQVQDVTRIDGTLKVGLGTASAASPVHIRTGGTSGLGVESNTALTLEATGVHTILSMINNTNRKKIAFGNSTAANDGAIDYDGIARGMRLITAGAVQLQISSAGLATFTGGVEIGGATVLTSTLAVTSTSTLTGDVGMGAAPSSGNKLHVQGNAASTSGWYTNASRTVGMNESGGTLQFRTNNADAQMSLDASAKLLVKGELELDGALNHDGSTAGLYGVTPVVRATVAALTDNTAGTADDTLQTLADGVTYANDVAALRNNLADLAAKINALRTALVNIGILNT